jgi:outer membrane immunogenic protein
LSGDAGSAVAPGVVTYSTDINRIGTVTGRLGFAVDRFLVYAKGGWATATVEVSGRNTALPDAFSISDRRNGWTVGGGLEYMATRNISLGIEYDYIDLGSTSYAGITAAALPFTISNADAQVHSVTARLNYRFYRDEPLPLK